MEHGAEHVDAEMRTENADVRYMDHHGIERRVGAKTRFEDVVGARALQPRPVVRDTGAPLG